MTFLYDQGLSATYVLKKSVNDLGILSIRSFRVSTYGGYGKSGRLLS